MELYEHQHFELFLQIAVGRFAERLEQRNEGAHQALARLCQNPEGEGVWMSEFIDAIFDDFVLSNAGGATFVMRALASRKAPALSSKSGQSVEQFLTTCAKTVFAELFLQKTMECLEQRASFEALPTATD